MIIYLNWKQILLNEKYLSLYDIKNNENRDIPLSQRAIGLFKLLEPKSSGELFSILSDSVNKTFRKATRN